MELGKVSAIFSRYRRGMTICLAHISALRYWRAVRCGLAPAPKPTRASLLAKTNRSEVGALRSVPWAQNILGDALHIAVSTQGGKRNRPGIVCHCLSGLNLRGEILRIESGIFVLSPRATFLQLSGAIPLESLAILAFELCGLYSMSPCDSSFVSANPLTTVDTLASFVRLNGGYAGCARGRKALGFVADRSASPAESRLAALLCAKQTLGGYGLPLPKMNWRVDVVGEGRKCTPHRYFVLDLYWSNAKLDVEYDSDAFHASSAGIASDAERRNALHAMGYSVITVTNAQLSSSDSFDDAALGIAHALGVRVRHTCSAWGRRRLLLRRGLLAAQTLR